MPKLERKIKINAPSKNVWKVITDLTLIPKWNFAIKEITQLEPQQGYMKANIGDFSYNVIEQIENKKIIVKIDHKNSYAYGFILNEKGDMTELSYWEDFKMITREKIQARYLEILLKEIKKFVEYLEDGGDPDEYNRN